MAEVLNVTVNGISMDYCRFGTGDKIFVILPGLSIQSVMGSADAVEEGYKIFAEEYTTYLFDRRKNLPSEYSIHDMAGDTAEAIKALGLKDIYLFGASQGGMIAMTIAIEHPELVKKMVLGSTSSCVQPKQQAAVDAWIDLARRKEKKELYQNFGKIIYPPEVYAQYEDYFAEVSKTVEDSDLERFIILAGSIRDFNVTSELVKIDCPTLLLGVYEDAVLDDDATMAIAEKLDYRQDFQLFMYKGYGHAAFDTAPDYRQRIYDFFQLNNGK